MPGTIDWAVPPHDNRTRTYAWRHALLPFFLLIVAVASHVLPHPWWNFTAVGGALLVWGARRPLASVALPVAVLAVADWYLTRFVYGYAFRVEAYLVTWAWYAFVVLMGYLLLRGRPGFGRCAAGTALAPTSFFLVSNYAVWAMPSSWYPHTLAGLGACLAAGLPFYRNDVIATALVVAAVWGVPVLVQRWSPRASGAAIATGR